MAGTKHTEKRDGQESWTKRLEVEKRERGERTESSGEVSGTRVGEGSNVIQIAGNLSQKQLGCARARDRRLINNQPLRRYRGSNVLKQSVPARTACRQKVRDEPFAEEKIFALEHYTVAGSDGARLLDRISASSIQAASLARRAD